MPRIVQELLVVSDTLTIERFVSMPFAENCYIVHRSGETDCFVVDPGFESDRLLQKLTMANLNVLAILLTHGHVDHIAGVAPMKNKFPTAPIIIGKGDAEMLNDPMKNLSFLSGRSVVSPPADILVEEGQVVELIGLHLQVREIPGHSPGHVVYIWGEGEPLIILGGDVLFQGGIGRFDFPGGDGELLVRGIQEKLYTLPEDAVVYPGHGELTTIGAEVKYNPFTKAKKLFQ